MLRFAIRPTRDMTIDDLRVAIYNYILSKQLGKQLIVRVDDSNKAKNIEGKDKEILELLALFSIEYSHAVYQSDSLKYHQKLAMQLMTQKRAFACFCSDEKLNELKNEAKKENREYVYDGFCENLSDETVLNCNAPFKVRIKKPEGNIDFKDSLQGEFKYTPNEVGYFTILRHNKTPTYNYACAVDDMLYDISLVVRRDKHLLDSAKQIYIRTLLNYTKKIDYIHIPSLINKSNEKSISVRWLVDEGILPSAIANYLVLIGNNTPKEIFSLEEAIVWFKLENFSKRNEIFDLKRLKEINKKHLEEIEDMRLSKILGFADSDIGKLAKLFLIECDTIKEIKEKIELIFSKKDSYSNYGIEFKRIKESLQKASYFDNFDKLLEYLSKDTNLEGDSLMEPLKYLLRGRESGPDIKKMYPLIKNYLGELIK